MLSSELHLRQRSGLVQRKKRDMRRSEGNQPVRATCDKQAMSEGSSPELAYNLRGGSMNKNLAICADNYHAFTALYS